MPISGTKISKYNDGHKRPLLGAKIKESLKKKCRKNAILCSKISKKLKVQKWPQKMSTAIRSKVMSKSILKVIFLKAELRVAKRRKLMTVTKDLSSGCKLRKVFKTIVVERMWFYVQKYKKLKVLKSPLRALTKELWAI